MMLRWEVIAFTIVILLAYLALRWPFFNLPLHIDTGFYVSNHTICKRRIDFSKGWNANFAGCSKVLPEFFYSMVYLLHGGGKYKFYSRFYCSLYNYATAIAVGWGTYLISGRNDVLYYYFGVITYCLLSSEPHYGVYFENAEQFELLFQTSGILLVCQGIQNDNVYFIGAGFGFWFFNGFFVKLSSMISASILAIAVGWFFPMSLVPIIVSFLVTFTSYFVWILVNKQNFLSLLKPLIGHEYTAGHRVSFKSYLLRFLEKVQFTYRIIISYPIIPIFAILGLFIMDNEQRFFVLLYFTVLVPVYFFQAANVWYYLIPFIAPVGMAAAFGADWLFSKNATAAFLVYFFGFVWLAVHIFRSYKDLFFGSPTLVNLYAWKPYGAYMAEKNLQLEKAVPLIRQYVKAKSFFIFGLWNQAYVLLETSYDTPLISAAPWLDHMVPNWQLELNKRFINDPPQFLLDTDHCLDVEIIKTDLGIEYKLTNTFKPDFQLFALKKTASIEKINLNCKPSIFN